MTALSPLGRPLSLPHHDQVDPSSFTSRQDTVDHSAPQHDTSTLLDPPAAGSHQSSELHRQSTSETLGSTSSVPRHEKPELAVDPEPIKRQRSKELDEPSEKQQRRAGVAGTAAAGAGGAAAAVLAGGQGLRGWDEHGIEDKHHVWSGHVAKSRKSAIKVCLVFPSPIP